MSFTSELRAAVPEPKLRPFRFRGIRLRRASDVLRVDQAVRRIGEVMYFDSWGADAAFDFLPLFWRNSKSEMVTVESCPGRRLRKTPIQVEFRQEAAETIKMFK